MMHDLHVMGEVPRADSCNFSFTPVEENYTNMSLAVRQKKFTNIKQN